MATNDIERKSPKEKKQRLVEYRKKYCKMWKNKNALQIKTD